MARSMRKAPVAAALSLILIILPAAFGSEGAASRALISSEEVPSPSAAIDEEMTKQWIGLGPPIPVVNHSAVWVPADKEMLIFGGASSNGVGGQPWAYSPSRDSWRRLSNDAPIRSNHTAVWDTDDEIALLFGGNTGSANSTDLWAYTPHTDTWTQRASGPPRSGDAVWDSETKRLLLYDPGVRDLWAYWPKTDVWERLHDGTGTAPGPRHSHSAVWDSDNHRMIVSGGQGIPGYTGPYNDSWAYYPSTNDWIALEAAPATIAAHDAVWDPLTHQMLVYGGYSGDGYLKDVWTYSEPKGWGRLANGSGPGERAGHSLLWAGDMSRVLMFGGSRDTTGPSNEIWEFNSVDGKWLDRHHRGTPAAGDSRHTMTWDETHNRFCEATQFRNQLVCNTHDSFDLSP